MNKVKIISVASQGPRGVKGDKGDKGLNFRGGFSGADYNDGFYNSGFTYTGPAYNIDDAVYFLGSSYVCIVNNTTLDPIASPSSWEILARKGDDGAALGGYLHTQSTPSSNWIINHNLGYNPIVQVFNSGSMEIDCAIVHISNNQVQIPLVTAITGFARLM